MSAEEWGVSEREAERLRAVLLDDERVLLLAGPRRRMRLSAAFPSVLLGLVMVAFLGGGAYLFGPYWWVIVLLFSPFWLVALLFLSSPLRYRWRMQHTLYVLTDKRAIVFEQLRLWRNRCICWPLFPGLVKKVAKLTDGAGNLIFDYEMRYSFDARRQMPMPVGFIDVPQLEQVQQLVAEQVAAVPEDEAPFAYRPSVLRTPAPRLDAWGTPLAEQPWDKKENARFFVRFGAVFIFLSLLAMGKGVCMLHTESLLEHQGVQTTATVLKIREEFRSNHLYYYPTLQFTDASGRECRVDYNISTDNFPKGHRLSIVYLPSDPECMRIVESGMSPGAVYVLGGSVFALVGSIVLVVGLRMKNNKKA